MNQALLAECWSVFFLTCPWDQDSPCRPLAETAQLQHVLKSKRKYIEMLYTQTGV